MDHVWEVHNDVSSYLFDSHQAAEAFKQQQPATVNMQLTQRKVVVTKVSSDLVSEVVQRALEYYAVAYGDLTLTSSVIARAVAGSLDENERSAKAVALAESLGYCWTGVGWLKAAAPVTPTNADREAALSAAMRMGNNLGVSSLHAIKIIAAYEVGMVPSAATAPAPAPTIPVKTQRKISDLQKQVKDLKASRDHHFAEAERYRKEAQAGIKTPPWDVGAAVERHFGDSQLQNYALKHPALLVRQLAAALLDAKGKLNNADTERLDYLQKDQVTLHLVPDHEDPGNAFAYKFCVGGLWKATDRDLRKAIDEAKAMQKANQNG